MLSRDENDPYGPVLAQRIEEVFTRYGLVWSLHVGGQVIQTTAEHPFYVQDRGWVRCDRLQVGDLLMTEQGHWLPVEDLLDTGEWMALYNFRVAEFHTYFVGTEEWGFSVWTHNKCWYHGTDSTETVSTNGLSIKAIRKRGQDGDAVDDSGFSVSSSVVEATAYAVAKTNVRIAAGLIPADSKPVLLVADDNVIGPFLKPYFGGSATEKQILAKDFPKVPKNAFSRVPLP